MDNKLLSYFSEEIRCVLEKVNGNVNEIRMRINKPLVLMCGSKMFFVEQNGVLVSSVTSKCVVVTELSMKKTFEAVCRYSIHSYQNDICEGFITLSGGHRVGICGTAVVNNHSIINVKDISSLNFRVANEILDCAADIYNKVFSSGLKNVIIAGSPSSGKTTILRDLCRILGSKYKVSVVDERGELAAIYNGIPQNDIGVNTDVFNGYSKPFGIETAVRVMAPDIVMCDEAGGKGDLEAFKYAMLSGVKIAATVHASNMQDIVEKIPFYKDFDYIVFLSTADNVGRAVKIIGVSEYNA